MALEDLSNNNNSIKKKQKNTRNKKSNERTTLKNKQEAIVYYKSCKNYVKTAEKFNVSRHVVMKWYKNKVNILNTNKKTTKFRAKSNKNRAENEAMEKELDQWITELREKGSIVSGFTIKVRALQIHKRLKPDEPLENPTFKASDGWLKRFFENR